MLNQRRDSDEGRGATGGSHVEVYEGPDRIALDPRAAVFYRNALAALKDARVPFMVGGAFAFSHYTGIARNTKDLDLFVAPQHADWALDALNAAGFRAEMIAPHWLAKAFSEDHFIDIIFSSGNGVAVVDDEWFQHSEECRVLDLDVIVCPAEEMIWSKGYILERERYDGADVAHLIRAAGEKLDWERLFRRFDPHWHVLFSHLLLFRFIYPSHRGAVPQWVMRGLMGRLERELGSEVPDARRCQGTLLSCRQYLVDVERWEYHDARLDEDVQMTEADIAQLTAQVKAQDANHGKREPQASRHR